ncbi:hypothetical protein A2U01_0066776, partial [Trifolium medium]|nr:hypothetical protein [Trifolium medium]
MTLSALWKGNPGTLWGMEKMPLDNSSKGVACPQDFL